MPMRMPTGRAVIERLHRHLAHRVNLAHLPHLEEGWGRGAMSEVGLEDWGAPVVITSIPGDGASQAALLPV